MVSTKALDGGVKLRVGPIPAMKSLALLAKLTRLGAHALLRQAALNELNVIAFAASVAAQLEPAMLQEIGREVLHSAQAETGGKLVDLDSDESINGVFSGNTVALLEAIKFAIEVHYGPFFGRAFALMGSDEGKSPEESSSN